MKALVARGADLNARITTSAMLMSYIGVPEEGRVRAVRLRDGRSARRDAAVGGRLTRPTATSAAAAATTPGSTARPARRVDIVQALLAAGADQITDDRRRDDAVHGGGGPRPCHLHPGQARAQPLGERRRSGQVLLEAGADINAVNEADFTALHGAAIAG